MGKKLTEEVAGIAPCACSGGESPVLYEKILRLAYLFMYFYRLYFQRTMIIVKLSLEQFLSSQLP
jgi:hypothetical protein